MSDISWEKDKLYAVVRAVSRVSRDVGGDLWPEVYGDAEVVHRVIAAMADTIEEPIWEALRKEEDRPTALVLPFRIIR